MKTPEERIIIPLLVLLSIIAIYAAVMVRIG